MTFEPLANFALLGGGSDLYYFSINNANVSSDEVTSQEYVGVKHATQAMVTSCFLLDLIHAQLALWCDEPIH